MQQTRPATTEEGAKLVIPGAGMMREKNCLLFNRLYLCAHSERIVWLGASYCTAWSDGCLDQHQKHQASASLMLGQLGGCFSAVMMLHFARSPARRTDPEEELGASGNNSRVAKYFATREIVRETLSRKESRARADATQRLRLVRLNDNNGCFVVSNKTTLASSRCLGTAAETISASAQQTSPSAATRERVPPNAQYDESNSSSDQHTAYRAPSTPAPPTSQQWRLF